MNGSLLILHIPHSSVAVPPSERGSFAIDDAALAQEILALTDMHTHELYDAPGAARIVFPVSRFVVDPERFADDALEPMAARGMGVIYAMGAQGEPLRRAPSKEDRRRLLDQYYHPHHARLTAAVEAALRQYGYAVIVDCHSFPSKALPYETMCETAGGSVETTAGVKKTTAGAAGARPGICIGTDAFHTPPGLSAVLIEAFSRQGYDVALDTPFSGALTPAVFYRKDPRVLSVMIEVRRDLYMDENTGGKLENFEVLTAHIRANLETLAAFKV